MSHYVVLVSVGQLKLKRVIMWAQLYTPLRYQLELLDLYIDLLKLHDQDRKCQ